MCHPDELPRPARTRRERTVAAFQTVPAEYPSQDTEVSALAAVAVIVLFLLGMLFPLVIT